MDLAKIRKKSLLQNADSATGIESVDTSCMPELQVTDVSKVLPAGLGTTIPGESVVVNSVSPQISVIPEPVISAFNIGLPQERNVTTCTPLEAILSGRSAAGCNDEVSLAEEVSIQAVADNFLEFLCFRVSDEIYGVNIMNIKEIIKPREVTEVPRAPVFVSGVLSLRGTIIPIIDMRLRLGLPNQEPTGKERVVVIKNSGAFSGLLVDEVIQVVQIQKNVLEPAPTVLDGIDRDFIEGIGRAEKMLIIILNLENVADINLY